MWRCPIWADPRGLVGTRMNLEDHPGFLSTSQGVIVLQADWPIYPEEHGSDLALLWLTAFPKRTFFKRISDIDLCILFLADVKCSNKADPFDIRNFHVAVWHEDLLELRKRGFIDGVEAVSKRRWEVLRRAPLRGLRLARKLDDGTLEPIELPPLDDYDEEDLTWPAVSPKGMFATPSGRKRAASMLAEALDDVAVLGARVPRLLELSFFDTCVRESCVCFEHKIKAWLRSGRATQFFFL